MNYQGLSLELTYHFCFLLLIKESYVFNFLKIEKCVLTPVEDLCKVTKEKGWIQ